MARGGARANSGPAPDANALRRDRDSGDWITLPEAGREGEPPAWPMTRPTMREKLVWARQWARPQAIEWERLRLDELVAAFVRAMCRFEKPKHQGTDGTLMKQLAEELGITSTGLARRHWRIGSPPAVKVRVEHATSPSARDRFDVIDGGA